MGRTLFGKPHFPSDLQTGKMEVRHIWSLSVLAVFFFAFIITVSGEARRGGGRRAKVFRETENEQSTTDDRDNEDSSKSHRQGKLFSLFNVVQFKNGPCASAEAIPGSGRQRNGTCHTITECADKGGQAEGNCAAGFGVCCIFVIDAHEGRNNANYNCTYLQNIGFPNPLDMPGTYTYNINKCNEDVCSLRLDFETFNIFGTMDTGEQNSVCNTDNLNIQSDTNQQIPTICGLNSGQHMYIDIESEATLVINLNSNSATWDIKVSQIECNNPSLPPDGCLQYHNGATGRITTFNFDNENQNHIANHEYSVCVRQESGFCCVQYQVCQDIATGAFSLNGDDNGEAIPATQDDNCINLDYVGIPESSAICDQTSHLSVDSRYCGNFLNNAPDATINAPVCACNPPFTVRIFTDNNPDSDDPGEPNNAILSRGVCLKYMQIPCAF